MRVLVVGDVVGENGCNFLRKTLPGFKRLNKIDICIVNGENSAQGNGVSEMSARSILDSGADVITTGNHAFKRSDVYDTFEDENFPIIRPYNFHNSAPGRGYEIIDKGAFKIAVINLIGNVYLEANRNPFEAVDEVLREVDDCKIKLVDFHCEATSEKRAMGYYLDGRVSAVFGTHTHVQTSDSQVLPKGTGYITDIGMTGPVHSVLGITPELVIKKLKTNLPVRFENPDGDCKMEGCIFEIDNKTGKTISAEHICIL